MYFLEWSLCICRGKTALKTTLHTRPRRASYLQPLPDDDDTDDNNGDDDDDDYDDSNDDDHDHGGIFTSEYPPYYIDIGVLSIKNPCLVQQN